MKNERLDLVVQEGVGTTVVEFKFPREPRQTQPPWPDHLGSLLADTYRLGALIGGGQVRHAIQVLVSGAAFLGFVRRRMSPLGLAAYQPGEHTPCAFTLAPTRRRCPTGSYNARQNPTLRNTVEDNGHANHGARD